MAWASLLISIAAITLAGVGAWYALREARTANALAGALQFLGQYRETETDRWFIQRELRLVADPQLGISDLPEEVRVRVVRVSHYLDQLGVLVEHRLIDDQVVAGFMGGSIIRLWTVLSSYIERERAQTKRPDYQRYFESLAARMKSIQPERARLELGQVPATQPPD